MHLTRGEASTLLPISRKGTKYLVRTRSNVNKSVSVLVALRDILKIARSSKEVKLMIHNKLLKINGRPVTDFRESIQLFNLFEADKVYRLNLLPTKKFVLEETKEKDVRPIKITGKKLLGKNTIQFNGHDGTNIISKDNIVVGDTLYLDMNTKVKKHLSLDKSSSVLVFKGSYMGMKGKIESIKDKKAVIKLTNKETPVELDKTQVIAL